MRKFAILGAAVLATALAGPTMAKEMRTGHHRHMERHMAQRTMPRQEARGTSANYGWNGQRESGFWPADVAAGAVGTAAGVAGAAVGTAGAIATAPFRTADSYAYDNRYAGGPGPITYDRGENGWYGDWNSYAAHNGLVCRPGTMFKDGDRMRPCQ